MADYRWTTLRLQRTRTHAHYRPGIRLVEGVLLLAHILHGPEIFPFDEKTRTPDSVARVPVVPAVAAMNGPVSSTSSEASED